MVRSNAFNCYAIVYQVCCKDINIHISTSLCLNVQREQSLSCSRLPKESQILLSWETLSIYEPWDSLAFWKLWRNITLTSQRKYFKYCRFLEEDCEITKTQCFLLRYCCKHFDVNSVETSTSSVLFVSTLSSSNDKLRLWSSPY